MTSASQTNITGTLLLTISLIKGSYVMLEQESTANDDQYFVYVPLRGQVFWFPLLNDVFRPQHYPGLESYFVSHRLAADVLVGSFAFIAALPLSVYMFYLQRR